MRPSNEPVEIVQDQAPVTNSSSNLVGGHPRQRCRQAQPALQEHRRPEPGAIGDAAPAPPAGSRCARWCAPPRSGGRRPTAPVPTSARRWCVRAPAQGWCRAHDPPARSGPAVIRSRSRMFGTGLGGLHRVVQPFAEPLRLGSHDLPREVVVLGGSGQILAHGLQCHGDHLTRQRLVDRRQPVEAPGARSPSAAWCPARSA